MDCQLAETDVSLGCGFANVVNDNKNPEILRQGRPLWEPLHHWTDILYRDLGLRCIGPTGGRLFQFG